MPGPFGSPVLEDFTELGVGAANEWSLNNLDPVPLAISGGQLTGAAGNFSDGYKNFFVLVGDCEVFCTVATATAAAEEQAMLYILDGSNNGYTCAAQNGGLSWEIQRVDASAGTKLNGTDTRTLASGDQFALTQLGHVKTAWTRSGAGLWTPFFSVTDPAHTYKAFVRCGIEVGPSASLRIDDWGAGMIVKPKMDYSRHPNPAVRALAAA